MSMQNILLQILTWRIIDFYNVLTNSNFLYFFSERNFKSLNFKKFIFLISSGLNRSGFKMSLWATSNIKEKVAQYFRKWSCAHKVNYYVNLIGINAKIDLVFYPSSFLFEEDIFEFLFFRSTFWCVRKFVQNILLFCRGFTVFPASSYLRHHDVHSFISFCPKK
jgi:hypothetical protein